MHAKELINKQKHVLKINYGPNIDYKLCNGCQRCYEHCPMDVYGWDEEQKMPTIVYAAECRFCCFCEMICPERAIDLRFPLHTMLDFG